MLTHLYVENFQLAKKLTLEFGPGFNVITGETGSGKSTLVKALQFLLGEKPAYQDPRTHISARFLVGDSHLLTPKLKKLGLTSNEVILRRTGADTNFCNDVPITLKSLKEFSALLLDVSLQHEGINFHATSQEKLLDGLSKATSKAKAIYQEGFRRLFRIKKQLLAIFAKQGQTNKKAYIDFQLLQMHKLRPSAEEFQALKQTIQEQKTLHQEKKSYADISALFDHDRGILGLLKHFDKLSHADTHLRGLSSSLLESANEVSFYASSKLSRIDQDTKEDPTPRLDQYFEAFGFFRVQNIDQLLALQEALLQEKAAIENAETQACELIQLAHTQLAALEELAQNLTTVRLNNTPSLEKLLNKEAQALGVKCFLKIQWLSHQKNHNPDEPMGLDQRHGSLWGNFLDRFCQLTRSGAEHGAIFMGSNAKAQKLFPMEEMASGGEASRLFFALKSMQFEGQKTLILDEIDAGVSGKIADLMGQKIKLLARQGQIICMSHLAQVVVYGDSHHKMSKDENSQESKAVSLSKAESLEEIAMLLSGEKLTKNSLANAKSLKKASLKIQNCNKDRPRV